MSTLADEPGSGSTIRLSLVIPTFNEKENIAAIL